MRIEQTSQIIGGAFSSHLWISYKIKQCAHNTTAPEPGRWSRGHRTPSHFLFGRPILQSVNCFSHLTVLQDCPAQNFAAMKTSTVQVFTSELGCERIIPLLAVEIDLSILPCCRNAGLRVIRRVHIVSTVHTALGCHCSTCINVVAAYTRRTATTSAKVYLTHKNKPFFKFRKQQHRRGRHSYPNCGRLNSCVCGGGGSSFEVLKRGKFHFISGAFLRKLFSLELYKQEEGGRHLKPVQSVDRMRTDIQTPFGDKQTSHCVNEVVTFSDDHLAVGRTNSVFEPSRCSELLAENKRRTSLQIHFLLCNMPS